MLTPAFEVFKQSTLNTYLLTFFYRLAANVDTSRSPISPQFLLQALLPIRMHFPCMYFFFVSYWLNVFLSPIIRDVAGVALGLIGRQLCSVELSALEWKMKKSTNADMIK